MATATMNDAPDPLAAVRGTFRRLADELDGVARGDRTAPDPAADVAPLLEETATKLADFVSALVDSADLGADADAVWVWPIACELLRKAVQWRTGVAGARALRRRVDEAIGLVAKSVRTLAVVWTESVGEVPEDIAGEVWKVRRTPLAVLRTMWNLFWSAVRHPLSDTTIDLESGRVLYRRS